MAISSSEPGWSSLANSVAEGISRFGPLAIYCACLPFPGFFVGQNWVPWPAYFLLPMGWLGIFYGYIAWLANPLFLIAFFLQWRHKSLGAVLAIIALVCAWSFLAVREIPINEGGVYEPIAGYGIGYFLWIASIMALLARFMVDKNKAGRLSKFVTALPAVVIAIVAVGGWYLYYSRPDGEAEYARSFQEAWNTACASSKLFITERHVKRSSIYFKDFNHITLTLGDKGFFSSGISIHEKETKEIVGVNGIKLVYVEDPFGKVSVFSSFGSEDYNKEPMADIRVEADLREDERYGIRTYDLRLISADGLPVASYVFSYATSTGFPFRTCFPDGEKEFNSVRFVIRALNEVGRN